MTSLAAGAALVAAFPPLNLWWLAPLPVGVLALLCTTCTRGRGGAGLGYLFGVGFFGGLLQWLSVLGPDAWIGLALLWAGWFAVLGWMLQRLAAFNWWPVLSAMAWVSVEAIRAAVPWGGFPWGRLAFSQADGPVLGFAALGGTALMTLVVALAGGGFAWAVRNRSRRASALGVALACALPMAFGALIPLPTSGEKDGGEAEAVVAVVQGNVPRSGLDFNAQRRAVLDNHARATMQLAADVAAGKVPQPDLVIWPENASDVDPYTNADAHDVINAAVKAIGVPTLVGAVIDNPDDPSTVLNVGIVWDPRTGPGERYAKQHPVPFGEYLPFRDQLTKVISRFERIPRDFAAGEKPGVLDLGPARIGDLICFEVAYDDIPNETTAGGARLLVVQTNNATYGRTAQPHQQLAMARIRAAESGRATLVAATSGLSAIIAPDGRVIESPPEFVQATMVRTVPLRDTVTIATRVYPWLERGIVILTVAFLVLPAIGRQRNPSAPADSEKALENTA